MAVMETISYKYPLPSAHVDHVVKGQVSHVETDCFWLQMEPDNVVRLGEKERVGDGEGPLLSVEECVVGWWEGDWYRGVVIKILEMGDIHVRFVDWGNMAILARDMVRMATLKEQVWRV